MIDASRISAHTVFASACADDSRRALAPELVDHRLAWGRGRVDTHFSRVRLQHLSLAVLRYGAEVEVTPEPFRQFLLVQMPLRGAAEMHGDGRSTRLGTAAAAIASPNRQLRLHWETGCEQLLIKVPLQALCDVARHAFDVPEHLLDAARVDFQPQLRLDTAAGASWRWMVEGLLQAVPSASGATLSAEWCRHLEESAMLFLLAQQPNWLDAVRAGPRHPQEAKRSRADEPDRSATAFPHDAADRLEAYIGQRLCAPVSLVDLARAANLSVRSLHSLCRQRWNESPMTVLRHRRLDAARLRLQQGTSSVTEAALDHGFGHLGRFSAYYRERFGELPKDTGRH